ncbi:DUF1257 domain-containing protein [Brevibacillus reuszeri]|uniref:DUF1257 domain-containing protein n=1 Tax=Brevibacillus reuszeri TaxID=54915 RepID=UPI000CCC0291|nr:DUF1257 domain-containing protein [Brevibacillus reuszeri]
MSHFTRVPTQITDIEALKLACKRLDLQLLNNDYARGWQGQRILAPYVIRLKGAYDIALTRSGDGAFDLNADWSMGKNLENEVGEKGGRLIQTYGACVTHLVADKLGMNVEETVLDDGRIRFRLYPKTELNERLRY